MKILYLAQCIREPSGGTKVMYQHVDILNELGHEAAIWHPDKGFRHNMFVNSTRIVNGDEITPDIIVSPPVESDLGPFKKIIFDQNPYYMADIGSNAVNGFMVVSDDSLEYLKCLYPNKTIFHVPNYIDPEIFPLCKNKKRIICIDGRKNWEDMEQVIRLIKPSCDKHGWELIGFNDYTEKQVSAVMQRATIYLQFGLREGLCLLPLEAMSCGCMVIGYHGQGGKEYVNPDIWDTIDAGNIILFAKTIIMRMKEYESGRNGFSGHEFVHDKYSREKTKHSLKATFESIQ